MGILAENLVWFKSFATGSTLLELGNQFLYICSKPYPEYPDRYLNRTMAEPVAAKPYFQELGWDHTSIDLNGNDGALPLDLSLPQDLGKSFDCVTDFGTSEHVPCLWQCLENVHRHTKVGGKIFHVNPLTGNWPGHGNWYRHEEFYKAYVDLTGYGLLDMKRAAACNNVVNGWNIWCVLEKRSGSQFPDKETFYSALPLCRS